MGRKKGSKNVEVPPIVDAPESTGAQANPEPSHKEPMIPLSQVQAMIAAEVAKQMEGNTGQPIDDTGYWQAKERCQSEIFGCIDPDQIIRLSEENEKALKLGKFAEVRKDAKTGLDVIVTYAFLKKPAQHVLQRIMQMGEGSAADEGLLILPSPTQSQSLDEKKPFKLVSAKS